MRSWVLLLLLLLLSAALLRLGNAEVRPKDAHTDVMTSEPEPIRLKWPSSSFFSEGR